MSIKKIFNAKFVALTLAAACAVATAASASAQSIAELTKKGKITIGVVSGTPRSVRSMPRASPLVMTSMWPT
jgi:polar amino acid transport system substrate-binding protein